MIDINPSVGIFKDKNHVFSLEILHYFILNLFIRYPTLDAGESFEFEAHTSEYLSAESSHTKLLIAISLAEEYDRKDLLDEDIVSMHIIYSTQQIVL